VDHSSRYIVRNANAWKPLALALALALPGSAAWAASMSSVLAKSADAAPMRYGRDSVYANSPRMEAPQTAQAPANDAPVTPKRYAAVAAPAVDADAQTFGRAGHRAMDKPRVSRRKVETVVEPVRIVEEAKPADVPAPVASEAEPAAMAPARREDEALAPEPARGQAREGDTPPVDARREPDPFVAQETAPAAAAADEDQDPPMPAVADVVTPQEPEEPAVVRALPDQDPLLPDAPGEAEGNRDIAMSGAPDSVDDNVVAEAGVRPDPVASEPAAATADEGADALDASTDPLPEARVTVNVVDRESRIAPFQVSKLVR
jgi:hypothetical protein